MSSGSYLTLYRKHINKKVSSDVLNAVKEQYKKSNDSCLSTSKKSDDFPLLMHASFKSESQESDEDCSTYYDKDGFVHDKLLEFHFGSSFTALKDKFRTNAYVFSESSVLISRSEAEKMLQAVEYILSENYSREFEDILNNEYVDLLGNGFSRFDDRFIKSRDKMYVEKDCDGWTVSFGDYQWDVETHECDEEIKSNLKRVSTCLRAFLDAECYSWDGHELVLEYSTY